MWESKAEGLTRPWMLIDVLRTCRSRQLNTQSNAADCMRHASPVASKLHATKTKRAQRAPRRRSARVGVPAWLVSVMAEADHVSVSVLDGTLAAKRKGPGRLVRVSSAHLRVPDTCFEVSCSLEGALRRLGLDDVQAPSSKAGGGALPHSAPRTGVHTRGGSRSSVLPSPGASSSTSSDPWDVVSVESPRGHGRGGPRHRRTESCPVGSAGPDDPARPLWSRRGRLRAPTSLDILAALPTDLGVVEPPTAPFGA
jgi:hypothetical protein